MNKNKLTVCKDRRTRKEKIPGSKLHKEKSDTTEGQANKTLGREGKLSWWSGG